MTTATIQQPTNQATESEVKAPTVLASVTMARTDLAKVLARLDATIPHRCPKETLRNTKISINGRVQFAGTNLETCQVETLDIGKIDNQGESTAIVNAKQLRKAVTSSKAKELTLQVTADSVSVGAACLPTGKLDEHPLNAVEMKERGEINPSDSWQGSAESLLSILEFCNVAVDPDSSRFALGGVCLEFIQGSHDNYQLRAIGIDGRRLHYAGEVLASVERPERESNDPCIVPMDAIKQVIKALTKADSVRIDRFSNDVRFTIFNRSGDVQTEIISRKIEGRFPNWQQVIPSGGTERLFHVDSDKLAEFTAEIGSQIPKRSDSKSCSYIIDSESAELTAKMDGTDQPSIQTKLDVYPFESAKALLDCHFVSDWAKFISKAGCSQVSVAAQSLDTLGRSSKTGKRKDYLSGPVIATGSNCHNVEFVAVQMPMNDDARK